MISEDFENLSMDNLSRITKEYEDYKGQFVLVNENIYRFVGIVDDTYDYYYCLFNGKNLTLHSCTLLLTPLKGFILNDHYENIKRIASLNHLDQPHVFGFKEDYKEFNVSFKQFLLSHWDENTKFILGPYWELN